MKKFLSILLAVLTVFSACAISVFAEDVSEPETTEPEKTYKEYEICEDSDFLTLQYLEKGNDVATILQPGDVVTTYKTKSNSGVTVFYYPDADAMYKGAWVPEDVNNIAFSPTAKEYVKDDSAKKAGLPATIKGIENTDFTIAYSDENVFVGWVVYEFNPTANSLTLCAVWKKGHKLTTSDDTDDFVYIIDFFYSLRKAISDPFFNVIKKISNAFLFVKQWLYDAVFNAKAA